MLCKKQKYPFFKKKKKIFVCFHPMEMHNYPDKVSKFIVSLATKQAQEWTEVEKYRFTTSLWRKSAHRQYNIKNY